MKLFHRSLQTLTRSLLVVLALGTVSQLAFPEPAEARAGRSRSVGRRQAPAQQPQQQPNMNQGQSPLGGAAAMNARPPGGGFMRGLAGGIAGGFLGSMLFSSMGQASGLGGAGGGGGGIGFLEILLFGGLAYFGYRWWKNRQMVAAPARTSGWQRQGVEPGTYGTNASFRALAPEGISSEEASDLFFKVQGAWTRRDLTPVRELLDDDVEATLEADLAALRAEGRINRLENIAVRGVDVQRSWNEDGTDFSSVRVTASLLDYTVDERTQSVVEGSDSAPVKFEEEWIFAKRATGAWRLAGIQQV